MKKSSKPGKKNFVDPDPYSTRASERRNKYKAQGWNDCHEAMTSYQKEREAYCLELIKNNMFYTVEEYRDAIQETLNRFEEDSDGK